jgi:hypothetical protein
MKTERPNSLSGIGIRIDSALISLVSILLGFDALELIVIITNTSNNSLKHTIVAKILLIYLAIL